jgi:type IV pilus assembly protein PilM
MLTINIEDNSLRMTCVRGKRVVFAAEAPLEAGWVQSGVVVEKAHVGQVISMVLAQHRISDKDVLACVSGIHSVYRVVYVPALERSLLAEAARKEMQRAIPVPLDSLYTSWAGVKISDAEVALCLVGIPFDNVNSVMDTLRLCRLRLKFLELKPMAFSRVIDEKTAIIVNVQAASFDLTIINDGIPELIRSLPFANSAMQVGEKAAVVKEEIDRTVNFYNSSHPNSPLTNHTPCFLSGEMRETLATIIGYNVKLPPSLLAYPAGQDDNAFVANTGLALRLLNRLTRVEVNVMPSAAPAARPAAAGGLSVPLVTLIICGLLAVGMFIAGGMAEAETARLQVEMNDKTAQLSVLQKQYREEAEKLATEKASLQKTLDTRKAPMAVLAKQRDLANRDLGAAISVLPGTIYLKKINLDPASLELTGSAPSEEILLNYVRDLQRLGLYDLVMVSSITNISYTQVDFIVSVTLRR